MAIAQRDMVMVTSSTLGIGTLALGPPVAGWSSFAAKFADGAELCFGTRELGGEWETARGIFSAAPLPHGSLSRVEIYDSSVGGPGVPIDWGAGEHIVYSTFPAALMEDLLNAAGILAAALLKAQNLADLPDKPAAIANLGLGDVATDDIVPVIRGGSGAATAAAALAAFGGMPLTIPGLTGGADGQIVRISAANTVVAADWNDTLAQLATVFFRQGGLYYPPGSVVPGGAWDMAKHYFLGDNGALVGYDPTATPPANAPAITSGQARKYLGQPLSTTRFWFAPLPPVKA